MDTNTMNVLNELGGKAETVIKQAADKVGQGVEHFWPIYVKQQMIQGWCQIGIWILMAIICAICWKVFFHFARKPDRGEVSLSFGVITFFWTCGLMIALLVAGAQTISMVFNPEYSALQEVIKQFKP
jgi:hypothetical protein